MQTSLALRRPSALPNVAPTLAVALAISSWGLGGALVKLMSIGGLSLAFYRLWLGAALMLAIVFTTRRRVSVRAFRVVAPAGLLFGVNVAFAFTSIRLTTVANATLIGALQPALVLLVAGPLFGERVTRRDVGWTAVAMAGILVVIAGSEGSPEWSPLGDALAFAALLTFTGYFLATKHLRQSVGTLELMAVVQLMAAVVVTLIALVSPDGIQRPGTLDWLLVLTIVCGTGVGAHLVVNWAHPYVDVTISSLLMLLVPVVAGFSARVILDEALTPLQAGGGFVTLAAILVIVRGSPMPTVPATAAEPYAPD